MPDPFHIIGNFTFPRTQPREWRDQPFDESHRLGNVLKGLVIALLFSALFGLSLWSISQQDTPTHRSQK